MSRNHPKAFGLALVAALALGAIGAQGASAVVEHSFRSDATSEKTVLTGSNAGETSPANHIFRAGTGGPTTTCTGATLSGTNIGNKTDTTTLHPKYTGCTAFGVGAPITTNGCNYIFDSDTTTNPHFGGEHAAVSLECETSHDITKDGACKVTIQESHTSPEGKEVTVNQSLHGVRYTAVTHSSKSSITVTATIGQIHYTTIGGIACNAIGKPQGTYTDGITEGKFTLTGFEDTDNSPDDSTTTGTTWTHGPQVNISLSTPE